MADTNTNFTFTPRGTPRQRLALTQGQACPMEQKLKSANLSATNNLAQKNAGQSSAQAAQLAVTNKSIFPTASSLVQSGALGAILGAATSGISNYSEYKQGKKSKEEAFSDVTKNTLQGAATMVVASVASHIVRTNPLFGVAALVAGGVGSYIYLQNKLKEQAKAVETNLNEEKLNEISES